MIFLPNVILARFRKKSARTKDLQAELDHIRSAMPIAMAERERLKKNKKAHIWMDDLIKDHRTRQLEIERELNA